MGFSRADLLKNVTLSVASTLVLVFLIEMVLRVTEVVPVRTLEYATPELWSVNPGPLLPGQSFTDHFKRSLPFKVTVDNLGFRGAKDLTLEKRPGTFRVLCLGDSYTFGAYVDDNETWPRLRAALQRWVVTLVQAIRAGQFPLQPRDEDCTKRCDFGQICRIAQSRAEVGRKNWALPLPTV